MAILITGGAGYIGANAVRRLSTAGEDVVVVDDFSTGHESRVGRAPTLRLDLSATGSVGPLTQFLVEHRVDGIIHFAAKKSVPESMERPLWYYRQNVDSLIAVLEAARDAGVQRLVFSSSAAVYGDVPAGRVDEDRHLDPANPYGRTKLVGELLTRDAARAGVVRVANLRYFNVAGAGADDLGDPQTNNLLTIVLDRLSRGEPVDVFGTDYDTPDGSCVRDFVHVDDLIDAHLAALDHLRTDDRGYDTFNVGTGSGASVLDVLRAVEDVTGRPLAVRQAPRRPGDPATVVADVTRIRQTLGWSARLGLREIVESAWRAWPARSKHD
ncbi:UDP-glucose 4-epimerase GalE [Blastococcus montanus]|uniref:UDP-glucose 4-epimerase GalE n=1 Tax=Blastococcus montanus TaxID=3144973 RepID=UPI003208F737